MNELSCELSDRLQGILASHLILPKTAVSKIPQHAGEEAATDAEQLRNPGQHCYWPPRPELCYPRRLICQGQVILISPHFDLRQT